MKKALIVLLVVGLLLCGACVASIAEDLESIDEISVYENGFEGSDPCGGGGGAGPGGIPG